MRRTIRGFTIIELLTVIVVIGIMAAISITAFSSIQASARDTQLSTDTAIINEALEKYYLTHGEYPSCGQMTGSAEDVATLLDIDPNVLTAPGALSGTNSIVCETLDANQIAYIGGGGNYSLQYLKSDGSTETLESRYHVEIALNSPSEPTITVELSGANVLATITPVTCDSVTVQYGIRSRINDGTWSDYSTWSSDITASQTANDGVKYGYQAQARCYVDASTYSTAATGTEGTYIDPVAAPAAPTVTANTVTDTTTWSWTTPSCAAGTSDRYQYRYTISPSGYDSGWVSIASSPVAFTTSTEGQTYTVQVQAQCFNSNATSAWGATGQDSYYHQATQTGSGTIQPATADTYFSGFLPTTNYDTNTLLYVGDYGSYPTRSIIKFDFSSLNIPAGSTITSTILSLYISDHAAGAENKIYRVSHLLRYDYISAQATWNIYKTGSNWTTAGAGSDGNDYTTTDAATYTQPATITNGHEDTWNITAQIQHALDSHAGVWISRVSCDNEAAGTRVRYFSSDYTTNTSVRPKLYIEWTG